MTNAHKNFSDSWVDSQKTMWDSWVNFTESHMKNTTSQGYNAADNGFNPMDFTKQWQGLFSQQDMPPNAMDFYNRIISASKDYFDMANRFSQMSKNGIDLQSSVTDWVENMKKLYGEDGQTNIMDMWTSANIWQGNMPDMSSFLGDMFKSDGLSANDFQGKLNQFLSMPALGQNRVAQENQQKLSRLMMEYQTASNAYNMAMSKVHMDALALFKTRSQELITSEDKNDVGFKDIYNLWISSCEDIYAEHALSKTYTKLYGDLINALMAVKKQGSVLVDDFLESMNIPTRKEVNTLHKRLQETRRSYRKMYQGEIEEMRMDIKELKDQISKLSKPQKTAPVKTNSTKKGK